MKTKDELKGMKLFKIQFEAHDHFPHYVLAKDISEVDAKVRKWVDPQTGELYFQYNNLVVIELLTVMVIN
jgi:hypothetical protein